MQTELWSNQIIVYFTKYTNALYTYQNDLAGEVNSKSSLAQYFSILKLNMFLLSNTQWPSDSKITLLTNYRINYKQIYIPSWGEVSIFGSTALVPVLH